MVAYVTEEHKDKINAIEWMKSVCDTELGGGVGGAPDDASTALWVRPSVSSFPTHLF